MQIKRNMLFKKYLPRLYIFIGLCLAIAAVSVYFGAPKLIDSKILDQIVITSEQHSEYERQFLTNNATDGPPKYNKLYFFHINNPNDFLTLGQKPVFQERGPYVFKETFRRHNVTFSADKDQVTFSEAVQNTFVPEMSIGSLDDEVTIINLPYVKVMSKFSNESALIQAAGTRVLPVALSQLDQLMIPAIKAGATAQAIDKLIGLFSPLNFGRNRLLAKMGGDCKDINCIDGFIGVQEYKSLLDIGMCYCQMCECSEKIIPLATMEKLMNSTDTLSILNSEPDIGISYWLTYFKSNNQTNYQMLKQHFNLLDYQMARLNSWLIKVASSATVETGVFDALNGRSISAEYQIKVWDDIPYRQMLKADVLSLLLNKTNAVSSVQPNSPIEIPFFLQWAKQNNGSRYASPTDIEKISNSWNIMSLRCISAVMNNDVANSLFELTGLRALRPGKIEDFTRMSLDNVPTNLTWSDCFSVGPLDMNIAVVESYNQFVSDTVLMSQIRDVVKNNGGLVVTRTVGQHALGFEEPLMKIVTEPSDPRYKSYQILINDPSLESDTACRSVADINNDFTSCKQIRNMDANGIVRKSYLRSPSTFYTGAVNTDLIGQYALLNGNATLNSIFLNGNMKIDGGAQNIANSAQYSFSAGLSFPPQNKVNEDSVLSVYDPTISVPLLFKYVADVTDLYGLKLKRFAVKEDQYSAGRFDANILDMSVGRSPAGLLNVTEPKGFAVFVSPPHYYGYNNTLSRFYDLSNNITNFIAGNNSDSLEYQKYWSFIDVEPLSGKTMRGIVRGQVVTALSQTNFDLFYPNVYQADYLPVYWKEVHGEISEPLAVEFTMVYTAQYYSVVFFYAGMLIGFGFIILGIVLQKYPSLGRKI